MTNSELIKALKLYTVGSPCIISWKDAVDDAGAEFTAETLVFTEVIYDTCGFFIGIRNDYVILGYNKENDGKTYRGLGYTPCSLVVDIKKLYLLFLLQVPHQLCPK